MPINPKKVLDSRLGIRMMSNKLSNLTKKIPAKYIGGNSEQARNEFWRQEPVMAHAVDSIANRYGISSEMLRHRIDKEGYVDEEIKRRNTAILKGNKSFPRGYNLLHDRASGMAFGLDDAATNIKQGNVKLINEGWYELDPFVNEKGRMTYPAEGEDNAGNIGIMAAHLKYHRDKAKQDFPNASEYDLNRYGLAYYNRGNSGGKKWVNEGAQGYNYRRRLESRGTKSK